ncbi:MAG: MFS transporter [Gemmatirosa sp.]|nr:MFS transporter [Gemmatirosa sp.]
MVGNPFGPLVRHRNFRLFWTGQTLSLIGTWMQTMAEGWLALALTNNAFLVGLVASAASLPVLLLSFVAGVYVDRVDRLRIVKAMQALMLVQATTLWLLTLTRHLTIGWLLGLAFANGMFSAFEIPARQSMIVELVSREELGSAIALNSSGFNLARVVGPAIGAAVIATLGIAWCFAVNAASYLAVLVGLFRIQLPARERVTTAGSPLAGLREGFEYMWHTHDVRVLMGVVVVFSVFGVPYLTLMPVVARDLLGLGAGGYGVLLAAVGVGGFAGALFLAAAGARVPRARLLVYSSFAYATLLLLFSLVRSAPLARVALLFTGFAMILNGALSNAILQSRVPDVLRGRLMAAYSFAVVGMAQVVGSFVGGAVARAFGADWAIAGGAFIMLGYATWTVWRHPVVWRLPVAAGR